MNVVALTLGLSSLTLAVFPLVRPFFPFDPRTPTETLAGAARAVTSTPWLIAHYLALIGFILLLCASCRCCARAWRRPASNPGLDGRRS